MRPFKSHLFALPIMVVLGSPMLAHADTPSVSPDRARAALEAGLILPLETLFRSVERRYTGRIIEAELHETGGAWSYEFQLLPANGAIYELELDARTGAVLRSKGPVQVNR